MKLDFCIFGYRFIVSVEKDLTHRVESENTRVTIPVPVLSEGVLKEPISRAKLFGIVERFGVYSKDLDYIEFPITQIGLYTIKTNSAGPVNVWIVDKESST